MLNDNLCCSVNDNLISEIHEDDFTLEIKLTQISINYPMLMFVTVTLILTPQNNFKCEPSWPSARREML